MPRSTAVGDLNIFEAEVRRVGRMQRHEDGVVVVVAAQHLGVYVRVAMAGEAEEAAFAGFLSGLGG